MVTVSCAWEAYLLARAGKNILGVHPPKALCCLGCCLKLARVGVCQPVPVSCRCVLGDALCASTERSFLQLMGEMAPENILPTALDHLQDF